MRRCCAAVLTPLNPAPSPQVTTTVLDDGRELESALVVVGVGARPNTQLLQGQVDVEDQKPGGIPVRCCRVQKPSAISLKH